jgi:hypothetical protein
MGAATLGEDTYKAPVPPKDTLFWYKADSLSLSDGQAVTLWADSSGKGNNQVQNINASPTYKANQLNGLPVVNFAGNNSGHVDQSLSCNPLSAAISPSIFTLVFVANFTGAGDGLNGILCGDTGSTFSVGWSTFAPAVTMVTQFDIVGLSANTYYLAFLEANGASSNLKINGSVNSSGSLATNNTVTNLSVGNFDVPVPDHLGMAGNLAEMILVPRVLTAAETTAIYNYLKGKWGVG